LCEKKTFFFSKVKIGGQPKQPCTTTT